MPLPPLNAAALPSIASDLAARDPDLAAILTAHGPPPLWERPQGFPTLVHIILEQQVSLASARAAFTRLQAVLGDVTPQAFLTLDDAQLKTIGFSRQKTGYARGLAQAIREGRFDPHDLAHLEDDDVRQRITALKGLGAWSADIYLLMALLRPDIFPTGDLALALAVQRAKHLPALPTGTELQQLALAYRPHRAVAARMFWHYYLSDPAARSRKSAPPAA